MYVASVKWVFQVMGDGRRFWLEGVELGRAKVESVEEVVARITEEAVDRGAEWEKRRVRVRMIARIRVGGGMTRTQQHTTRMWMVRDTSCQKKAPIIEGGWSEGLRDNRGEYSAIILYNLIYNYTV